MRIAFFVTYFPKLSEVFLLNQGLELLARGHDLHIFALADPAEAQAQPGTVRLLEEGRVHIAKMPAGGFSRMASLPRLWWRLGMSNVRRAFDYRHYGPEAMSMRNLYRIDQASSLSLDFDVAHAQFGEIGLQCALLRELGYLRAPLVTSFRGNDLSRYVRQAGSGVYRKVFEQSAFCLPVATRWASRLEELGCPPEKIRPLASGIPMQNTRRRRERNGREDFPRIVSACRLDRHKGIHLALPAFARLRERYPFARYDIFGDGPERRALEEQARRIGIAEHVRFHGAVAHDDLLEVLSHCDFHWFTSVTLKGGRTEGVPNVLKESQATGLPAIAFDHPGADEVVSAGQTGLLVPEGDYCALADETARLAVEVVLAQKMGARAAVQSRERFDLESVTGRLEQIYAAAVAGA